MEIRYVRGHMGDIGNEKADELAGFGADFLQRQKWWKRPYVLGDWSEDVSGDVAVLVRMKVLKMVLLGAP